MPGQVTLVQEGKMAGQKPVCKMSDMITLLRAANVLNFVDAEVQFHLLQDPRVLFSLRVLHELCM